MRAFTKLFSASFLLLVLFVPSARIFAQGQCGETILTASDGQDGDFFGSSVALYRNLMAVGAISADRGAGSVYLFRDAGSGWAEQGKLVATDSVAGDSFGSAIALNREQIIITAPSDDDLGSLSGSAYVYTRASGGFEEMKLLASDGRADHRFGVSVATEGNRIVVGARGDDDAGFAAGAAYVFRFDGSNWVEEAKLLSSDLQAFDIFGVSVAMGGRRIAVGALGAQTAGVRVGAVYVFRHEGSNWIEEAKLVTDDPDELDFLGNSVAMTSDGTRLIAGAVGDGEAGFDAGAAYVFRRDGTNWSLEAKLLGDNTAAFDQFGMSVAISHEKCAVGAPYQDDQGATYLFEFDGASWSQTQRIEASDETIIDEFGNAIAMNGKRLVVGAPLHPDEFGPGAAYLYEPSACSTKALD